MAQGLGANSSQQAARRLLFFAVRLYTRLTDAPDAKLAPGMRLVTKDESFWMDNGERSIHVTIKFGPYWDEEEESV